VSFIPTSLLSDHVCMWQFLTIICVLFRNSLSTVVITLLFKQMYGRQDNTVIKVSPLGCVVLFGLAHLSSFIHLFTANIWFNWILAVFRPFMLYALC